MYDEIEFTREPGKIHDALNKVSFGVPQVAARLLPVLLPPSWVDLLALARLESVPTNFVREDFAQRDGDLIFKVPIITSLTAADSDPHVEATPEEVLYLTWEHFSGVRPVVIPRTHEYGGLVLDTHEGRFGQSGPYAGAVGLVLHTGPRQWDLMDTPPPVFPGNRPVYWDARAIPLDALESLDLPTIVARLTLRVFVHGRRSDLLQVMKEELPRMRILANDPAFGLKHFRNILFYSVSLAEKHMAQELMKLYREEIPETERVYRTLPDEWFEAGHARGRVEGRAEGRIEGEERGIAIGEERGIAIGEERGIAIGEERGIAIGEARTLRQSIRAVFQARGMELTDAHDARIGACSDIEQLQLWLRDAAIAHSVESVLG